MVIADPRFEQMNDTEKLAHVKKYCDQARKDLKDYNVYLADIVDVWDYWLPWLYHHIDEQQARIAKLERVREAAKDIEDILVLHSSDGLYDIGDLRRAIAACEDNNE